MPDILVEERQDSRRVLIRKAALYGPGGIVATALFLVALFSLLSGNVGAIFAVVIMGLVSFAVDYEAMADLRDLRATPITTEGPAQRIWSKGRIAFLGRVHYLLIERRVFEVSPITALEVTPGEHVRIEHWPHTNTVIAVHRVRPDTPRASGTRA